MAAARPRRGASRGRPLALRAHRAGPHARADRARDRALVGAPLHERATRAASTRPRRASVVESLPFLLREERARDVRHHLRDAPDRQGRRRLDGARSTTAPAACTRASPSAPTCATPPTRATGRCVALGLMDDREAVQRRPAHQGRPQGARLSLVLPPSPTPRKRNGTRRQPMISFGPTEEQELVRADRARVRRRRDAPDRARVRREARAARRVAAEELGARPGRGADSREPTAAAATAARRSPTRSCSRSSACGDAPLAAAALTPALFVQPILDLGTEEQKRDATCRCSRGRRSTPRRWRCSSRAPRSTRWQPAHGRRAQGHRLLAHGREAASCRWRDRASHFLVVARGAREGSRARRLHRAARCQGPDDRRAAREEPRPAVPADASRSSSTASRCPAAARLGGDDGHRRRAAAEQRRARRSPRVDARPRARA